MSTIRQEIEDCLRVQKRKSETDRDYVKRLVLAFNDLTTVTEDEWHSLSEKTRGWINENLEKRLGAQKPLMLLPGMSDDGEEERHAERNKEAEAENEAQEASEAHTAPSRLRSGLQRRAKAVKRKQVKTRSGKTRKSKPAKRRIAKSTTKKAKSKNRKRRR